MPILAIILAAFIIVPLIEIGLFIQVGGAIGMLWTLGLVVATAVAGTALLRQQGRGTIRRARAQLAKNTLPLAEAFDGVMLIVSGALLLTPGFLTDALGGLLLIPLVRRFVREFVIRRFLASAGFDLEMRPVGGGGTTIEGDFGPAGENGDGGEGRPRGRP